MQERVVAIGTWSVAGRKKEPIVVTGLMYVWIDGYGSMVIADQMKMLDALKAATREGALAVPTARGGNRRIIGLALGKGHGEVEELTTNIEIPTLGLPITRARILATPERVPGLPCEVGFTGTSAQNRKWMVSVGQPLNFWLKHLWLPQPSNVSPGHFRWTSASRVREMRVEMIKEAGGGAYF